MNLIPVASLNGRLLISVTEGKNLGELKGIFFDDKLEHGLAAYLGKSGILSRKEWLLDLKHIQLFGVDAWLVAGSAAALSREEFTGAESFVLAEELYGREVQTDGGTRIGTIKDLVVDARFKVLGFSLAKVFVQGPLAESMSIARAAVSALGDKRLPMIASLEQAEKLGLT